MRSQFRHILRCGKSAVASIRVLRPGVVGVGEGHGVHMAPGAKAGNGCARDPDLLETVADKIKDMRKRVVP